MNTQHLTPEEEYDLYADPANHAPQGAGRRRNAPLAELVPVRFDRQTIAAIRELADHDDRSVSSWIRRAVQHELDSLGRRSA